MPVYMNPSELYVKNPNGNGYLPQNTVSQHSVEDVQAAGASQVSAVNSAGATQVAAINTKAGEVTAQLANAGEMEDMVAGAFSTSKAYKAGDYVIYTTNNVNKLYRFNVDHAAGAWNSAQVSEVKLGDETSSLKSALDYSTDSITHGTATYNPYMFIGKQIRAADGAVVNVPSYPSWTVSDFILIPENANKITSNAQSQAAIAGLAFYDKNQTFIPDSGVANYASGFDVLVPATAKYIRFTNTSNDVATPYLTFYDTDGGFPKIIEGYTVGEAVESSPKMISKGVIHTDDGSITYVNVTTWACTDYIPIPKGTKIIETNVDVSVARGSSLLGNAFYDSSKTFIANSGTNDMIMNVPNNAAYIRLTANNQNSQFDNIWVKFRNQIYIIADEVKYLSSGEKLISNVKMTQEKAINTTTGAMVNFAGYPHWKASDFIEIPDCTTAFKTNAISQGSNQGVAFYDESKIFITGSGIAYYTGSVNTFNIRKDYKYVRITDSNVNDPDINLTWISNTSEGGIYSKEANFADAIASGKMLKGNYVLNSQITLKPGQTVIGSECTVTVTDNGQIIMNNESKITGIKFVGNWNPTRVAGDGETYTQFGYVPLITYEDLYDGDSDALYGENKLPADAVICMEHNKAYNVIVDGCRFENLDRLCILAHGQRHQDKSNCIVCNNYFADCRMGVFIEGEFNRVYANEYLRCIVGCDIRGANSNNFGEIFKCCDVGYYIPENSVAHNEITACEAAHCGLAGMYIRKLQKIHGCIVSGCHFPDAPIIGVEVNNLYISSSLISTYLKYESGKHNAITCCNVRQAYLYGKTQFDVPADTLITLNRAMDDDNDADVNWPTN